MRELPTFMQDIDTIKLDSMHSYGEACNYGKACAFEFIRSNIENGAVCGGLLQQIALTDFGNGCECETYKRGFAVGFFSQIEELLNQAYKHQWQADSIKSKHLNNADLSPLSFRGRDELEGVA